MANEDPGQLLEKAGVQLASGEFEKSFRTYRKATEIDPASAPAYFGMAEASMGIPKKTVQEVALLYQKACDLAPENALYYATYGTFCFENGILKKGEECFLKASEIDEENSSLYLSELATSFYHSAVENREKYPNMADDDIRKTALKYILQSFDITKEKAKKLIDDIELEDR